MRKFADLLRKENGLTLIELIAALSIFSLVAGLIYGVLMFGINSYQRVTMENTLRDESDLLMSAIITELYTFAPSAVSSTRSIHDGSISSSLILHRTNIAGTLEQVEIKIADGKLSIEDLASVEPEEGMVSGALLTDNDDVRTSVTSALSPVSSIGLECSANSQQPCESGQIDINLSLILQRGDIVRQLDLNSKFGF